MRVVVAHPIPLPWRLINAKIFQSPTPSGKRFLSNPPHFSANPHLTKGVAGGRGWEFTLTPALQEVSGSGGSTVLLQESHVVISQRSNARRVCSSRHNFTKENIDKCRKFLFNRKT